MGGQTRKAPKCFLGIFRANRSLPGQGMSHLCCRGTVVIQEGRAQPAQRKTFGPLVSEVWERKVAPWPSTAIKGDPTAKLRQWGFGKSLTLQQAKPPDSLTWSLHERGESERLQLHGIGNFS